MRELNIKYMSCLPEDVIINHVLPYTYMVQPKHHLQDIRNFVVKYDLLESYYMTQLNEIILLNDLLNFLYMQSLECPNFFESVLRRVFHIRDKSIASLSKISEECFYKNIGVNAGSKTRIIWGLFTPMERAIFISVYLT